MVTLVFNSPVGSNTRVPYISHRDVVGGLYSGPTHPGHQASLKGAETKNKGHRRSRKVTEGHKRLLSLVFLGHESMKATLLLHIL